MLDDVLICEEDKSIYRVDLFNMLREIKIVRNSLTYFTDINDRCMDQDSFNDLIKKEIRRMETKISEYKNTDEIGINITKTKVSSVYNSMFISKFINNRIHKIENRKKTSTGFSTITSITNDTEVINTNEVINTAGAVNTTKSRSIQHFDIENDRPPVDYSVVYSIPLLSTIEDPKHRDNLFRTLSRKDLRIIFMLIVNNLSLMGNFSHNSLQIDNIMLINGENTTPILNLRLFNNQMMKELNQSRYFPILVDYSMSFTKEGEIGNIFEMDNMTYTKFFPLSDFYRLLCSVISNTKIEDSKLYCLNILSNIFSEKESLPIIQNMGLEETNIQDNDIEKKILIKDQDKRNYVNLSICDFGKEIKRRRTKVYDKELSDIKYLVSTSISGKVGLALTNDSKRISFNHLIWAIDSSV